MNFKEDFKYAILALILTFFIFLIDAAILYVIVSCLMFFVGAKAAFTLPLYVGIVLYIIFFEGIRLTILKEFKDIKDGVYTKK